MNNKTDLIDRVEFAIPSNKSTRLVLNNIRKHIVKYFGGATQIRSQLGGLWLDENEKLHNEDIVLFIIYYNTEKHSEAEEVLAYLTRMLIESGEEESWLIYQNAKRMIYSKEN